MNRAYHRWRKFKNVLIQLITCACALLVIVPLALIFYYVLKSGIGAVNWGFFTQLPKPVGETGGGMANAILGTFELLGLAALIGVPVGVCGGIFLSEYGSLRLNWWIRFGADVLNGVPSIIWGMVVYALVVMPMKGFSSLAGGMVLGMMMIPLIMRTAEEVLGDMSEQAALGNWRLTFKGKEIFTKPRVAALRTNMLNHMYHHRGQLSVYLRLLDVPVPMVYGPTADDNPFA